MILATNTLSHALPQILLMAQPSGSGQESNPIMTFLPMIVIFAIIYFMMIRPQKKRQKEREALISKVEKGDKVVTSSGIHGTVAQVEDTTILVQVSDTTKIRFEKASVNSVVPKNAS
jgi:preprotein translocase subunit YajC